MSFPFTVSFRLISHTDKALKNAPTILAHELKGSMKAIGKRLQASASIRMREDTGDAIKSLVTEVTGKGLSWNVVVYSTLLKAFIDAYGMRPGTRVPYGFGSRLQTWAQHKVRNGASRKPRLSQEPYTGVGPHRVFGAQTKPTQVTRIRGSVLPRKSRVTKSATVSKANARARSKNNDARRLAYLAAKSIYVRGIKATHWNRAALEANKSRIIRELQNGMSRAANRMNRG